SGCVRSGVRFQTIRSWPANRTRPAISVPIRPSPRKAIVVMNPPFRYVARCPEPGADLPGGVAHHLGYGRDARLIDPGVGPGDADARHDRPGLVEDRPGDAAQVRLELPPRPPPATPPPPPDLAP